MSKLLYVIIESFLNKNGYNTKRISGNAISILTNESREKVLADVSDLLNSKWDKTPSSRSSVGFINVMNSGFKIYVKPEKKQGNGSAGLKNEKIIFDKIYEYLNSAYMNLADELTIQFDYGNGKYKRYDHIVDVYQTGLKDTKSGCKSDIELIRKIPGVNAELIVPISIKKLNAQCWESSDKKCKNLLKSMVNYAMITDLVNLEKLEFDEDNKPKHDIYRITKSLAARCSKKMAEDVIFGSDIQVFDGCVIFQTFSEKNFKFINGILHIEVDNLVSELKDLPEKDYPYILVRNDKTRTSSSISGVRVLAVTKSRINNNTVVLNYEAN